MSPIKRHFLFVSVHSRVITSLTLCEHMMGSEFVVCIVFILKLTQTNVTSNSTKLIFISFTADQKRRLYVYKFFTKAV